MTGRLISRTWQHQPRLNAPAKYRRACRYEAYVPDLMSRIDVRLPLELAGLVADAETAIRDLNASARPELAPLARLLLRTESIASSRVEGMQMDSTELARAEARLESGRSIGSTALQIMANIDAMTLAIDEAASAGRFTIDQILAIHAKLMTPSPNARFGGRIREVQNWIGGNDYNPCGADFVPPPPEHVHELLDDLCDAVTDDRLPTIVQAALVHAQFETIHPFEDGNGRTGRALIHVVLRRRGVAPHYVPPISVVLARSTARYIAGLTAWRNGDMEAWIEHFSGAAAAAAHLATDYVAAVRNLTGRWRAQLAALPGAPRADAAAWRIIEVLPAHPILSAPVAAAVTVRSRPQVYQAISHLEAAGVLVPLSTGKRNRAWEAVGLLDLVAGLEAGEVRYPPNENRSAASR